MNEHEKQNKTKTKSQFQEPVLSAYSEVPWVPWDFTTITHYVLQKVNAVLRRNGCFSYEKKDSLLHTSSKLKFTRMVSFNKRRQIPGRALGGSPIERLVRKCSCFLFHLQLAKAEDFCFMFAEDFLYPWHCSKTFGGKMIWRVFSDTRSTVMTLKCRFFFTYDSQ